MPDYFPAFLDLRGRRCLVVGGGAIAVRKVHGLLECGARGALLVIAATGLAAVDDAVAEAARRRGALVNAVDRPARCDFIYGSVLRRGQLQIAVSTGGRAPALAREIRRRLEPVIGVEYAALVERVSRARRASRAAALTREARLAAG